MKTFKWNTLWTLAAVALFLSSCDFLDQPPRGSLSQQVLANEAGAQALLIGAYGALDGQSIAGNPWETSPDNWIWGSVAGGDAHKGSDATDQPAINPIFNWQINASNGFLNSKWRADYEGISRANAVLALLPQVEDATDAVKSQIEAEARFLRGHYYFDLKKMFNMVPWIDETTEDFKVPNNVDIWPNIEADFKFAMDNLPETQAEVGRVNKWAAAAYLAKTYLYQEKWQDAATLFATVITQGQTSSGIPYALTPRFQDMFDPATEDNSGMVFAIQATGNDGTGSIANSNQGDMLNFPYNSPFRCCGFYQPTQELVNSYRVDPTTGLPLIDTHNDTPIKSDQAVGSDQPFTPDTGTFDPRLDWTVGRRGVPYLDWGPHPGQRWIRDQAFSGPYAPKKNIYRQATQGQFANNNSWAPGTALNYPVIRFADVLLMAAEAEAHVGNLPTALDYVNRVRARAANPDGWVKNSDNEAFAKAVVGSEAEMLASGAAPEDYVVRTDLGTTWVLLKGEPTDINNWQEYTIPNYKVEQYPAGSFTSQDDALKKIRFERKLELAMEGQRFFDLSRWGTADEQLNAFYEYEGQHAAEAGAGTGGITDVASGGHNVTKYYPIPQRQIDLSVKEGTPTLAQNPDYGG
ncbi:MAG TPA: RagB/SusD family nutrient uptake outer membrane protein [Rhodothermales bacterium]|nr:RagB/SusD family nutrient uptake outer membrane protein [Rhodothermales bacterium]